jgi:hypothetical protein
MLSRTIRKLTMDAQPYLTISSDCHNLHRPAGIPGSRPRHFLACAREWELVDQRRQAQELVDRLDAVRNYAKLLHYVRFTDHVSRPLITEAFTGKTKTVSEVPTEVVW